VSKSVLTQNLHLTPSTQQAEQASFTREKLGTCRVVPGSSIFTARKPCDMTYSYEKLSANELETIQELQSAKHNIAERMM
jgi:hypothetical protein